VQSIKKLLDRIEVCYLYGGLNLIHCILTAFWKQFKYPGKVQLINRVLLIGFHESVQFFNAPDAESLFKITAPFHELGVAHSHPAMPIEEA